MNKKVAELKKYLGARRPILWCSSTDYKEIDELLVEASNHTKKKAIYEYRALGTVDFESKAIKDEGRGLYSLIDAIQKDGYEEHIFLLIKNAKEQLEEKSNLAYIKKIAEQSYNNPEYHFTTVVVSDDETVPKEIEQFTSILDLPKMNEEEISSYIGEFAKKHDVKVVKESIGELALSLKGLTKLEIDHVLGMIIESHKNISVSGRDIVIREKGQIIKKSAVLELIDFKEKVTDIGGLEGLKEWLESKAKIFRNLDKAKKFGVDTPKGVLLVGMPGCGKSLAAKVSARMFNAPLLRLDIGRLLGKYVGESEYNMRVALKMAESISPCVLWIDEIEKAFSGIDQSGGASDITKRLFGQFLTWLQEKENTVFVMATANDISSFPPEFLRKGRFDEVFFVDFPNEEERERIFEIHLEKRGRKAEDFDCLKLAKETKGYSGADIEEIVKLSLEHSFVDSDGEQKVNEEGEDESLTTKDLQDTIKEIDPLGVILEDKIKLLKEGFEKFKIKSATKKLPTRTRNRKSKKNKDQGKNKNLVYVAGGRYTPSFYNEERGVGDLEVMKYQTTQDMWMEVMDNNPSHFKGGRRPVEQITWWEALEYCNKLSEKEGLAPVYEIIKHGDENYELKINQLSEREPAYPNEADFRDTEGYRLPTELEWEWFARGGEIAIQDGTFDDKYPGGSPDEIAWHKENSGKQTHDVGTKKPNALGIYDCIGNVWEYCYDTVGNGNISEELPYQYDSSNQNRRHRGNAYSFSSYSSFIPSSSSSSSSSYSFRIVRTV